MQNYLEAEGEDGKFVEILGRKWERVHFLPDPWGTGIPLLILFMDLFGIAKRKEDLMADLWSPNQNGC